MIIQESGLNLAPRRSRNNYVMTQQIDPELEMIGRVVHEAIRALSISQGEEDTVSWDDAPAWMREDTISGIRFRQQNPTAPISAQHDHWLADKQAKGWRLGPQKDPTLKIHPMMVAYDALPHGEQKKDAVFVAIVTALSTD